MGPVAPSGQQPPQAYAQAPQNGAPTPYQQAMPQILPMVQLATGLDNHCPMLTLIAQEKFGKSTTAITSLIGYPEPHMQPLVLAWDEFGPDACAKLGYIAHAIRMGRQPGNSGVDKMRGVMRSLEQQKSAYHAQYGSIVVDCMSTAVGVFKEDAKNVPKNKNNPNTKAPYFELAEYTKEFVNRVIDFGLPSIWLAWQTDGHVAIENKVERQEMGGMDLDGKKVRNFVAGRAHHNFILEKKKIGVGAVDNLSGQRADDQGYIRLFHSQPWNMVNAGGRYSHLIPEPCPPHFGWVLGQITGRGQFGRRS